MVRAAKIEEMLKVFKPFPLGEKNFNDFFVETKEARGDNASFRIIYRLRVANGLPVRILFMGHSGSGKSTELYRIEKELAEQFEVVKFSIRDETDVMDLTYIDLIFAIMNNIFAMARHNGIKVKSSLIDDLFNYWHDEEVCETTDVEKIDISAEYEAKVSFLTILSAKIKGIFQMGVESKNVVRRKIEPCIKQLITYMNEIISDINVQFSKLNKQLLLVVEDLDKLDINAAEELFIKHRKVIASLNIHTIYTFPIYLFYSTFFNEIKDDFDSYVLLSMIKTRTRSNVPYESGISTIKNVIAKRCDLDLISSEALTLVIEKSGGALRDIFEMLENAVLNAKIRDISSTKIELIDIIHAYNSLKSGYERVISRNHVALLKEIYSDSIKKPIDDEDVLMCLLKSMAVIEYNGERWCGLHPAIEDFLKEKGEIT